MMTTDDHSSLNTSDSTAKIQALRDMIGNAERTIQSAKAMLLQLEGKKKTGRPKKLETDSEGTVIEGTFDGQIMMGTDGKQYPVPANYASKSKLVEGDYLKLTITPDGSFIYKQINPIDRKHAIGVVSQDEGGNYHIVVEGVPYRVLLASITYFRVTPGDEVAVVLPRDLEASWVAIENVLQKGFFTPTTLPAPNHQTQKKVSIDDWKKDIDLGEVSPEPREAVSLDESPATPPVANDDTAHSPLDEWMRDMEALEKEVVTKNE